MPDAFISYSRKNIAFARLLMDALEKNDIQIWIDWQDIPPSADWLAEVYEAIESSDNFIFIISENSVVSEICDLEIKHAIENNKRLIPIVVNEVEPSKVPAPLSALNWIFFTEDDQFHNAVRELIEAMQVDQAWVKQHTRLQNRALTWTRRDRNPATLLRGQDLNNAETWLSNAKEKEPPPTHLQAEYIFASRKETARRQRIGTIAGAAGILIAFVLGIWAWSQRAEALQMTDARATAESMAIDEANTRATAEAEAITEERSRATAQAVLEAQYRSASAKSLAAQSSAHFGDQLDLGLLLALEALNMEDNLQTRRILITALTDQLHIQKFLFRDRLFIVDNLQFDPQGDVVIYSRVDQRILVLDPENGSILFDVAAPHEIANLYNGVLHAGQPGIRFSPDGKYLLTAAMDRSWILWDAKTYQPIGDPITDNPDWQAAISVSPYFDRLATLKDDAITIWDRQSGTETTRLEDLPGQIYGLPVFTYDAQYFIVPFEDQVVNIYAVESGEVLQTFQLDPDFGNNHYLVVNSQGTRLGISGSEMVYLFDLTSGEEIGQYRPYYGDYYQVFFDANGQAYLIFDYKNKDIYIERLGDQNVVFSRFPHFEESTLIDLRYAIDPSSMRVATSRTMMVGSEIVLYDPLIPHPIFEPIEFREMAESHSVGKPAFHPTDDHILATATCGDVLHVEPCEVNVWDISTTPPDVLYSTEAIWPVSALTFHPEGNILAVAEGHDGNVSLLDWRLDAQVAAFTGTEDRPSKLAFSSDGDYLAMQYNAEDTPVLVWNLQDEETSEYFCATSDDKKAFDIAFHPAQPFLAIACGDRASIWNVKTGAVEAEYTSDENLEVFEVVAFHPDGSQFATGGEDGFIRWDMQSAEPLSSPSEDTTSSWGVDLLAYEPMGSMLLTGSVTNLRIFDAQSGDFFIQLDPLGENTLTHQRFYLLPTLAISAQGSRVAAYARDNQLIFWQLDLELWKQYACSIANRNLTADEWKTYLGDIPYRKTCP